MNSPRRTARTRRTFLLLSLTVFVFFVPASPATAHATLVRTEPAANAQVATEPGQVVLHFDQPVNLSLGQATVVGPDGTSVSTGYTSSDNGATVTITLRPGAGAGTYVASYRVISLDTHPVAGGFFFQVGHATAAAGPVPAVPTTPGATSESAPEVSSVRALYAACRYAGFIGLLLLIGAAVFLAALWPVGVAHRRVTGVAWCGYGLLVAGSMGELVLEAPYAAGVSLTALTGRMFDEVIDTRYGTAHLVRLGLLAVTAPVLVGLAERRQQLNSGSADVPPPARWPLFSAAPIGLGLLFTWAESGHAGTTEPGLSVPSDVLHLAAMAVWLGGLVVLAAALLPIAGASELRATLPAWSRLAMICVAALVLTGAVQGLLEVENWTGLVDTTYGRLLLVKIALLAVILAVANFSRLWVKRYYAAPGPVRGDGNSPGSDGTSRAEIAKLRRAVSAEAVFGAAAVAVAAVLIQAAPPRAALARPAPAAPAAAGPITRSGAYVAAVHRGDVVIHMKVDPAVVGVQYIYLDATRPGGTPVRVRQWTLTVSEPQLGIRDVEIPVIIDTGVGHRYIYGSFTMPVSGPWTIRVVARTSDVDETVVTRKVTLRS